MKRTDELSSIKLKIRVWQYRSTSILVQVSISIVHHYNDWIPKQKRENKLTTNNNPFKFLHLCLPAVHTDQDFPAAYPVLDYWNQWIRGSFQQIHICQISKYIYIDLRTNPKSITFSPSCLLWTIFEQTH